MLNSFFLSGDQQRVGGTYVGAVVVVDEEARPGSQLQKLQLSSRLVKKSLIDMYVCWGTRLYG